MRNIVHTEKFQGFTINLELLHEDCEPDWDMTEEERLDLLDKIERGVYLWFCARVTVEREGIVLGFDHLGGCCYPSVEHFLLCDYYADMKNEAITEARKELAKLCNCEEKEDA